MPTHSNHSQIIDALLYIRTEAIKAKMDADRDELCNAFIRPCPTLGMVNELIANGLVELDKDFVYQLTDAGTAMLRTEGNPKTKKANKVKSIPAKAHTKEIVQFRADVQALLTFQEGCASLQESAQRFLIGNGINSMEMADLIKMFDRLSASLKYLQILLETETTEEKIPRDAWLGMMLCLDEHAATKRLQKTSTALYQQFLATARAGNA